MSTLVMTKGASFKQAWSEMSVFPKTLIAALSMFVLVWLMTSIGHATDGAEFDAAATQFQTWVGGNLGRLAAFAALGIGAVVAAIRKDWSWFFGAVILCVGIGVITTVIDSSFTAVL